MKDVSHPWCQRGWRRTRFNDPALSTANNSLSEDISAETRGDVGPARTEDRFYGKGMGRSVCTSTTVALTTRDCDLWHKAFDWQLHEIHSLLDRSTITGRLHCSSPAQSSENTFLIELWRLLVFGFIFGKSSFGLFCVWLLSLFCFFLFEYRFNWFSVAEFIRRSAFACFKLHLYSWGYTA